MVIILLLNGLMSLLCVAGGCRYFENDAQNQLRLHPMNLMIAGFGEDMPSGPVFRYPPLLQIGPHALHVASLQE
jgi:hypothetical protein